MNREGDRLRRGKECERRQIRKQNKAGPSELRLLEMGDGTVGKMLIV